ncbi:MAG: hypothetical protein NC254_06620 [bacterium]|nr:hypothetical protein [bacterium]
MIGRHIRLRCITALYRYTALCIAAVLFAAAGCGKKEDAVQETMVSQNFETYALSFYQYGGYIEEDTAEIDPEEFRLYHDGVMLEAYPYRKLSDFLISLYAQEAEAYAICRYELAENEMHMTLDLLGATSKELSGNWDVVYSAQNSTAKLELLPEGLGREYEQFDAAGKETGEETSFFYCFRGKEDDCRLLLLMPDKYYIYEVEADFEQRTMRLTIAEECGYTQEE